MDDMIRIELAGGLVIAPSWDAIAKLHAKVADLGKRVGHMEKDGKNDFHKYQYISYEQAAAAIRSALPEIGLSLSVGVAEMQNWDTTRNNKGVERRLVTLEATLTDTETGAMRVIRWYGEGEDQNDKATAKAITSGVKYLLMRNLSISSEDDVEPDAEDGKPTKAPAQRQARPTPSGNGHSSAPTPQPQAEPSTTATAERPASGNGHNAPSESNAEPPEWQGQFFGWLKQAAEKQGLEMMDDLYGTLKNLGHMKPHLAEYDKLYEAQKAAMGGMKALVASGGPA